MPRELKLTNEIYFADFETLTENSQDYIKTGLTAVFLWGLNKINEDKLIYGYSIETFFEELLKTPKTKIIYFHNLSFDGNFIYKYLLKKYKHWFKDGFNNTKKNYNYWTVFKQSRRIYYIDFCIKKKINGKPRRINIFFQCTYNLLNTSIANLAKSVGGEKHNKKDREILDIFYGIKTNEDFYNSGCLDLKEKTILNKVFIRYLKSDIEIMKKSYLKYRDSVEDHKFSYSKRFKKQAYNLQNILTSASVVQKICKNWLSNNNPKILKQFYLRNRATYEYALNFISGGYCQFSKKYHNKEFKTKCFSIDENSAYAFAMTKKLPYGAALETKPNSDYLEYYEVKIKFMIKEKYENIPCIKSKEMGFRYGYAGEGTYFWLKEEFELYKKIYDIKIYSIKKTYFKAASFLKPLILELYEIKKNAIGGEKLAAKLLLNSLYGSFVKKAIYDSELFIPNEIYEELKEKNERDFFNGKWKISSFSQEEFKALNLKKITALDIEQYANLKKFPHIFIGATITTYARIYLIETILKLGVENFLYSDTDSIFFKWDKPEKELFKLINIDDNELGAWKIEGVYNKGKILGAKRYVFNDIRTGKPKSAMAGLNKNKLTTYEEFEKVLNAGCIIENASFEVREDENGIFLSGKNKEIKIGTI